MEESKVSPKLRLDFVDSLRALAAVYVVLHHMWGQLGPYEDAFRQSHPLFEKIFAFMGLALFRHGHLAVAVFIVISGFCLMLPLAQKGSVQWPSFYSFVRRRAWRILPPYYFALALSLLLIYVVPGMNRPVLGWWNDALPALNAGSIISHFLLVHHWSDRWIFKINGPLWSVGVEWQMYFLMPTLFLPLLRKFGAWVLAIFAWSIGIVLLYVAQPWLPTRMQYIDFIALFATGMLTAEICVTRTVNLQRTRELKFWSMLFQTLALLLIFLLALQTRKTWAEVSPIKYIGMVTWDLPWFLDYLTCAVICTLLIGLCQERRSRTMTRAYHFLNHPLLIRIGGFSYSLYLIHDPIIRLVCVFGESMQLGPTGQYVLIFFGGVPASISAGLVLYFLVERRFLNPIRHKAFRETSKPLQAA